MPGPRKVRVFRDRKKSPNWYVEWRDLNGHRHCESCGPHRTAADERAAQITAELQAMRTGAGIPSAAPGALPGAYLPDSVVQLRVVLRCSQVVMPVDLLIEMRPELLKVITQALRGPTAEG